MDRDFNSKCSLGRAPHGEKNAPEWRGSVVQEVFGFCLVSSGAQADESM